MKLSKPQQQRFWRDWAAIKRQLKSQGHTDAQCENERYALLERSGFGSLTEVDHMAGFDRVLAELAAILRPADIEPQLRAQEQPKTRLIFACKDLAAKIVRRGAFGSPEQYLRKIALDRFGTFVLNALTEEQLTQLRNTCADRLAEYHKERTIVERRAKAKARRQAATETPARIDFPDADVPVADSTARVPLITCPVCGTEYPEGYFCDECEIRRQNQKHGEQMADLSHSEDNTPF